VNNHPSIAISGVNGFVGRNVGLYFLAHGFEVIGISRKKRKYIMGLRSVVSENLLEKRILSKVRGSLALLHFIGIGKQAVDCDYESVNVGLTKNAIRLCKRAGIKKIVYISGLGVDEKATLGYFISKFKAEQEIIKSGLDYTIFRSSYILGKEDSLSRMLKIQIKRNLISIPGSGNYRIQPIFVKDVSRIMMKAITERQFSRKIIDLAGPKTITYKQFIIDLLQGRRIKIRNIDFEKAYHDALHGKNNQFGVDDLGILVGDYIGNHKRLAKISGMEFTKYDEMLKACSLS
jgi:NADH dehydrogenase